MVYRGRPSTGCKKCRERRIKCDERPGGCVKCSDRHLQCPGYDRNIDNFFHDETANVQAKAKKAKAKAIATRDAQDEIDARNLREAYLHIISQQSPTPAVTASLIDQGISFFMSYYALGVDQPPIQSIEYSKHLSTHGFHPLVSTSMTALGIAGIANLYMDSRLKREATRWYLDAIKMTNAAISSPTDVTADSTLASINLLGMVEATSNENSLQGWSNHVEGAASLIKLRGMDQFSTPAGQRMYLHTVGLFTMNCMGKSMPIPKFVHDLNTEIIKHLDAKDPRNRFFFLHIKTSDLRARILNQQTRSLPEIIESALELDNIAANIFKDSGPEWDYDIVLCEKRPEVFDHFYHVYFTAIAAQTWNWVRYNRIYFHDIIRNCILAGFASTPPALVGTKYHEQLETSVRTLYSLQSDILAGIPQFLHDVPGEVPSDASDCTSSNHSTPVSVGDELSASPATAASPKTPPNTPAEVQTALKTLDQNFKGMPSGVVKALIGTGSIKDKLPIVRVAGGYSTVWALFVAGAMPIASPESQDFVANCMVRVQKEFGINQAQVLGKALKYKRYLAAKGAIPFSICPQYLPPDSTPFVRPKQSV
ncbi:hypothetical protein COCC4DRAFT_65155 [Bipolaris maydis ATCC 48331]|uniref:Zn(2)-C6 fungal-type domain-containing protein n=2 Tax=Cochliobolus heterostrophus TaxID=5016 RepID=M2UKH6_COCH5|nr:uncharacterized protein COCC4DRAFT_65155 [Bipolaris maydis ATCC 48331]EMD88437.1 hypothetical protein COCHEDRAFT_1205681 [Bipolaris maydis C5]KAJ5028429.1 hypothetical protein J3E73DRAFT_227906 [Bipolaris maydis]ENI00724.1 hypothetical protein COCC4DRAFT_65155 [Bipolaris maydis ATCC 48331]KAJ5063198.1 hypothetical protein J3E74DRAFT_472222 [Bipolaris maydis]KAJ6199463.1 hypothetical protein J3E72DRAFT_383701 [Bipolaris maydis]